MAATSTACSSEPCVNAAECINTDDSFSCRVRLRLFYLFGRHTERCAAVRLCMLRYDSAILVGVVHCAMKYHQQRAPHHHVAMVPHVYH